MIFITTTFSVSRTHNDKASHESHDDIRVQLDFAILTLFWAKKFFQMMRVSYAAIEITRDSVW